MKNITKLGLSALAGTLAITSANAGEMSLTGSMEATYTTGSGYSNIGNELGMDKELSVTGSTDVNGNTVSYKQTITDAMAYNDSELSFGTDFGTIALTSAGAPISAIDDVTPTAFEEANAMVGSIDDVNGNDGTYGIRYTLADVMGSGFTVDAFYTGDAGSGDAQADNGTAGTAGAGSGDGKEIVIKGSVPMVEGLSVGAGYAIMETINQDSQAVGPGTTDQDEGTAYVKYATGPFSLGYQIGAVSTGGNVLYKQQYYGISYTVSDDLSVSYNWIDASKTAADGLRTEQDFDSISASYSMGGMTINIADSDCSNCSYSANRSTDATTVSLAIAF